MGEPCSEKESLERLERGLGRLEQDIENLERDRHRLDSDLLRCTDRVNVLMKVLDGNGKEGLLVRLGRLEDFMKTGKWVVGIVVSAAILGVISAGGSAYVAGRQATGDIEQMQVDTTKQIQALQSDLESAIAQIKER